MIAVRRLLRDRRALCAALFAAALLMKLLVPAGFMPVVSDRGIAIEWCSGYAPPAAAAAAVPHMAMPGMTHHPDEPPHQGREMPCAFAGLSAPSLAAVDAPLLALAIAFIVATTFRTVPARAPSAPPRLRPPSRGPPVNA